MLKQIIVLRKDLKLGKGKIAVQVAHASLESYKISKKRILKKWEKQGSKKVVLKADDLKALMKVKRALDKNNIRYVIIRDAGLTQIPPGTITCIGIEEMGEEKIDNITRKLKML